MSYSDFLTKLISKGGVATTRGAITRIEQGGLRYFFKGNKFLEARGTNTYSDVINIANKKQLPVTVRERSFVKAPASTITQHNVNAVHQTRYYSGNERIAEYTNVWDTPVSSLPKDAYQTDLSCFYQWNPGTRCIGEFKYHPLNIVHTSSDIPLEVGYSSMNQYRMNGDPISHLQFRQLMGY